VSISRTFYSQLFCMNVFCTAVQLKFVFEIFWGKLIGKKAARKMSVKLTKVNMVKKIGFSLDLKEFLWRIVGNVMWYDEDFEKFAKDLDVGDVRDGCDLPESVLDHLLEGRHVLVEQDCQVGFFRLRYLKKQN
jgi:hypothetical protein